MVHRMKMKLILGQCLALESRMLRVGILTSLCIKSVWI
jgi:hypothetical protein